MRILLLFLTLVSLPIMATDLTEEQQKQADAFIQKIPKGVFQVTRHVIKNELYEKHLYLPKREQSTYDLTDILYEALGLNFVEKATIVNIKTDVLSHIGDLKQLKKLTLINSLIVDELRDLKNLKHLEVRNCDVPDSFFDQLLEINTLTSLEIVDNNTSGNPCYMGDFFYATRSPNLEYLIVKGVGATKINPEIKKLTKLKHLDLSGNPLENLPPELFSLPLRHLNLSSCGLKSIPHELFQMKTLNYLNVAGNHICALPDSILKKCPDSFKFSPDNMIPYGSGEELGWFDLLNHFGRERLVKMVWDGKINFTALRNKKWNKDKLAQLSFDFPFAESDDIQNDLDTLNKVIDDPYDLELLKKYAEILFADPEDRPKTSCLSIAVDNPRFSFPHNDELESFRVAFSHVVNALIRMSQEKEFKKTFENSIKRLESCIYGHHAEQKQTFDHIARKMLLIEMTREEDYRIMIKKMVAILKNEIFDELLENRFYNRNGINTHTIERHRDRLAGRLHLVSLLPDYEDPESLRLYTEPNYKQDVFEDDESKAEDAFYKKIDERVLFDKLMQYAAPLTEQEVVLLLDHVDLVGS